jgi:hypothetical protein
MLYFQLSIFTICDFDFSAECDFDLAQSPSTSSTLSKPSKPFQYHPSRVYLWCVLQHLQYYHPYGIENFNVISTPLNHLFQLQ